MVRNKRSFDCGFAPVYRSEVLAQDDIVKVRTVTTKVAGRLCEMDEQHGE